MIDLNKPDDNDQCQAFLHSFVPIVENDRKVGILCTICGKAIYEEPSTSGIIIGKKGLVSGHLGGKL